MKAFFLQWGNLFKQTGVIFRFPIHWVLSRFVIALYVIFSSLILSTPFFALFYFALKDITQDTSLLKSNAEFNALLNSDTANTEKLLAAYSDTINHFINHLGAITLIVLCIALFATIFAFFFGYSSILTQNLVKNYWNGEKLPLKKNLYFSKVMLKKYFSLVVRSSLYGFIPLILCLIVFFASGYTVSLYPELNLICGVISSLAAILSLVSLVFLSVCTIWAQSEFLQDNPLSPKESFNKAKKTLFAAKGYFFFMILFHTFIYFALKELLNSAELNLIQNLWDTSIIQTSFLYFLFLDGIASVFLLTLYNNKKLPE